MPAPYGQIPPLVPIRRADDPVPLVAPGSTRPFFRGHAADVDARPVVDVEDADYSALGPRAGRPVPGHHPRPMMVAPQADASVRRRLASRSRLAAV